MKASLNWVRDTLEENSTWSVPQAGKPHFGKLLLTVNFRGLYSCPELQESSRVYVWGSIFPQNFSGEMLDIYLFSQKLLNYAAATFWEQVEASKEEVQ